MPLDAASAAKVKEVFPAARVKGRACELTIRRENPADVAADLRRLREALQRSKDFKKPVRAAGPK